MIIYNNVVTLPRKIQIKFRKNEDERVVRIIMARDEAQLWRVALFILS